MDVNNLLKSTKVALEKQAVDNFGAVVEDYVRGAGATPLPAAATGVYQPQAQTDPNTWYASSYAAALAGTSFRPKLKFLFKVEFAFNDEVARQFPHLQNARANDFTFMIKTVDRPKVDFEYEDEVNEYNFRTKVLKKIKHRELTMTFMDDVGNRVFDFFRTLMLIYSPITRNGPARDGTNDVPNNLKRQRTGMMFSGLDKTFDAHRGVINAQAGGAIKYIRIKQIFLDPSVKMIEANHMVYYDFFNPRLVSFDLDDMSHESSDPNLLTMQFDYDWMEMVKIDKINAPITPLFPGVSQNAQTAPVDLLSGITGSGSTAGASGGTNNPFTNIISGRATSAAESLTSTIVNRAVQSVAGRGPLGTAIGGALGSVGGLVGSQVNGLVTGSANSLISGVTSAANNAFTSIIRPIASDSSTLTSNGATIIRSIIGGQ